MSAHGTEHMEQSTQIDGVGAQDTIDQYKGFFDRRIDWRGQKRSKTTGSCPTMDLNEHYDVFSLFFIYSWYFSASLLSPMHVT